MECSRCEGTQLCEDEDTGQLICVECGAATGFYQGLTQSQENPAELRGLQLYGKADVHVSSQHKQTLGSQVNLDNNSMPPPPPSQEPSRQRRGVKNGDQPNSIDSIPWRLSEVFTYVMRLQVDQLTSLLPQVSPGTFNSTCWHLWITYLGLTGELGELAWLACSSGPSKSAALLLASLWRLRGERRLSLGLVNLKSSYSQPPKRSISKRRGRKPASTTVQSTNDGVDWQLVAPRLLQFHWFGWSSLYEPSEGRELRTQFLLPLGDSNTPDQLSVTSNHDNGQDNSDQEAEAVPSSTKSPTNRIQRRRSSNKGKRRRLSSSQSQSQKQLQAIIDSARQEFEQASSQHSPTTTGLCGRGDESLYPLTVRWRELLVKKLLPLAWLVRRQIEQLNLPIQLFHVVRLLLRRLATYYSGWVETTSLERHLICWIPWPRAVRPELVSMALLVITLRLLFKLDGSTEYRLSRIARLLTPPTTHQEDTVAFNWSDWMKASTSSSASDNSSQEASTMTTIVVKSTTNGTNNPLLIRARSPVELAQITRCDDFLGSAKDRAALAAGESTEKKRPAFRRPDCLHTLITPLRRLTCSSSPQFDVDELPASSSQVDIFTCSQTTTKRIAFTNHSLTFLLKPSSQQAVLQDVCEDLAVVEWFTSVYASNSYSSIQVGRWSSDSWENKRRAKNRHRSGKGGLVLPLSTERLMTNLTHLKSQKNRSNSSASLCSSSVCVDSERGFSSPPADVNRRQKSSQKQLISATLTWLINFASSACCGGLSPSYQTPSPLLGEIEFLERVLGLSKGSETTPERLRLIDLAYLSCFNLTDCQAAPCNKE